MKRLTLSLSLSCLVALFGSALTASTQRGMDDIVRDAFQYRNLGPFRAGAWVSDVAVPETPAKAHLYTFYVAARNGGVWKTTNNGTTFAPVFEGKGVASIGSLAVAPSDSEVVWVGTGDA